MAFASFQSLHQHLLHNHNNKHPFQTTHLPTFSYNDNNTLLFIKPKSLLKIHSNLSSTTTTSSTALITPPSPSSTSLDLLSHHLSNKNYRLADDETRRLLIAFTGENAIKRGYVFFSEVQFIDVADLQAVDKLWLEHSDGKFGYSVQRKVWEKVRRDFTRFFIKVEWMKKLDTEIEQYNYRSFPNEFIWELDGDTPEGHLPLTNALRGTQLLGSVLTHPAFEAAWDESEMSIVGGSEERTTEQPREKPKKPVTSLKPDYSF